MPKMLEVICCENVRPSAVRELISSVLENALLSFLEHCTFFCTFFGLHFALPFVTPSLPSEQCSHSGLHCTHPEQAPCPIRQPITRGMTNQFSS